ncbi:acyl carrier protein [Pediococcus pentosaceus]|jgi:acyl carrier protein|uniref:Acyl carrier protein n=3 Tax=Pediococcus pentosaceus TaxID=1255 RepID=A0A0R2H7Y8_PEDPE|nr:MULTISPECIES: acyl carrier protein [Pediococcus]ABJ67915.1 Acyl carrier protein [Pediococcus pentosaceus ATCC 25745]AHA04982.1 acyl carrier protein [Pediococcus pentosaceus SL4]ANI97988.1 acyl carrier protein [Pediococcus pentosaceus]ARW19936.1 Acyl carrier protein [Pediococcus pentosaceus]ASC08589.1 Acyl carrier protein [Pediococcus pentosaceus]
MTKEEVFTKVQAVIAEQLEKDADKITMETSFSEDLDADSLDIFEVVDKLEDEFDIDIDTDENMDTVGKLVDYVSENIDK